MSSWNATEWGADIKGNVCATRAVVMEAEGGFEAAIFDLGIFASGDTEEEAIANLKETLLDTFDRLNELPDTRLGKGLLRQKGLLNKCVRRAEKG